MDSAVSLPIFPSLFVYIDASWHVDRYFRLDAEEKLLSYSKNQEAEIDIDTVEITDCWLVEDPPAHYVKEPPSEHSFRVTPSSLPSCSRAVCAPRALCVFCSRDHVSIADLFDTQIVSKERTFQFFAVCRREKLEWCNSLRDMCQNMPVFQALNFKANGDVVGLDGLLYKTDSKGKHWTDR